MTTPASRLSLVPPRPEPIQLHIGAGMTHIDGWVNQDLYPAENIDLAFDLMKTWPLADNSVKTAYASHVLEHLPDPHHFFRELWRVCRPNASVMIRVPYGAHDAAWWDLTHLRPWLAASFCFLQPGYADAVKNPQHNAWDCPFGVEVVQLRLAGFIARKLRRWYWRVLLWDWLPFMWNGIEEITAYMYALKSPEAIAEYLSRYKPATVPIKYAAWEYQVFGRPPPLHGEPLKLIDIADGEPIATTYKV